MHMTAHFCAATRTLVQAHFATDVYNVVQAAARAADTCEVSCAHTQTHMIVNSHNFVLPGVLPNQHAATRTHHWWHSYTLLHKRTLTHTFSNTHAHRHPRTITALRMLRDTHVCSHTIPAHGRTGIRIMLHVHIDTSTQSATRAHVHYRSELVPIACMWCRHPALCV